MTLDRRMVVPMMAALVVAVAGCDAGIGARAVDYSPQRGYSEDISSSLNRGPTSTKPGMVGTQEPIGAMPWDINQSGH
jgi:hypothetical protein